MNLGQLTLTGPNGLIVILTGIVNQLVFLVAGIALLVFIWSLVKYLATADDAEARKEWRGYMIYGVIAFTVISGIWGLVNALTDLFGLGFSGPQFPTNISSGGAGSGGTCPSICRNATGAEPSYCDSNPACSH